MGKGRVVASQDIEATLRALAIAPDVRFTGGQPASNLPFVHRKLADGDSYFIVNRSNRPIPRSCRDGAQPDGRGIIS